MAAATMLLSMCLRQHFFHTPWHIRSGGPHHGGCKFSVMHSLKRSQCGHEMHCHRHANRDVASLRIGFSNVRHRCLGPFAVAMCKYTNAC